MITTKRPNTDNYTQVGFIEAKDAQGNYQNIDKIYDNQGNIVFQQGYLNEYQGADDFGIPAIGKPLLDYTIYGNTVQSGTPTPDSPIEPEFVGELVTEGEYAGQYAIPISSAGQTQTIYLGQVQTTRRIEKIKLNDFSWTYIEKEEYKGFYVTLSTQLVEGVGGISNKFAVNTRSFITNTPDNTIVIFEPSSGVQCLFLRCDSANGSSEQLMTILDGAFLYAVLATPEVGIVNEPLCRIGDYADSVNFEQAGVEIPTLKKPNTTVIDVETSLEPSEVDVTYRGSTKPQYNLFLAKNGESFEAKDGQSLYIGGNP